jgi:hypothetical protein
MLNPENYKKWSPKWFDSHYYKSKNLNNDIYTQFRVFWTDIDVENIKTICNEITTEELKFFPLSKRILLWEEDVFVDSPFSRLVEILNKKWFSTIACCSWLAATSLDNVVETKKISISHFQEVMNWNRRIWLLEDWHILQIPYFSLQTNKINIDLIEKITHLINKDIISISKSWTLFSKKLISAKSPQNYNTDVFCSLKTSKAYIHKRIDICNEFVETVEKLFSSAL